MTTLTLNPRSTLSRINLLKNPSARTTIAGYVAVKSSIGLVPGDSVAAILQAATTGQAGVRVGSLTIGTDLVPNTTYTFSGSIRVQGGGAGTWAKLSVSGSGVVYALESDSSSTGYNRRSITFTTLSSGLVQFYLVNSASSAANDVLRGQDFIVELGSTVNAYFDGGSTLSNHAFAWTGTADNSPSTDTIIVDPDTTCDPQMVIGYEVTRAVNTVVHNVPAANLPPVTFKKAATRSGTLQYLFADRETCRKAEIIHTSPGYITVTDSDWPGGSMRYVAQGEVTTRLDPDTRTVWVLETGFQEA